MSYSSFHSAQVELEFLSVLLYKWWYYVIFRTVKVEVHNTREILKITDVIGTVKGVVEPGMSLVLLYIRAYSSLLLSDTFASFPTCAPNSLAT